jgi:hypothetical protein
MRTFNSLDLDSYPHLRLPITLLSRYFFFLSRRPVSTGNAHYLRRRLNSLKSLKKVFEEGADIISLQEGLRQLDAITPANFARLAEKLHLVLMPLFYAIDEMPGDVVVSSSTPPASFWHDVNRVLLLLGPAIGIGDEIILFPLPLWLKATHPNVEVTVLSAYKGLWNDVAGVDRTLCYRDHLDMLQALRGKAPFDGFDMVLLADFERPNLCPAVCFEGQIERYVELALGTQSLFLVDNRRRWLYRAPQPMPYFVNYYFVFDYLMRWMGLDPHVADRFSAIVQHNSEPITDHLRVYVSPFTSKYDPSSFYWSHLLGSLFQGSPPRPVQLVLDTGANASTERFASTLLRAVTPLLPNGVTVHLDRPAGDSPPLQALLSEIGKSHIVICTDSFAAHAAPPFGCATLVLAKAKLENWRVPHRLSYYFDADAPLSQVVAGMQQVMRHFETEQTNSIPISTPEENLEAMTCKLQGLFNGNGGMNAESETLREAFRDFACAYNAVVDRLPHWPAEFDSLFADFAYQKFSYALEHNDSTLDNPESDLVLHMRDRWQQWQNTNLRKYLGLALGKCDDRLGIIA